MAKIRGGLDFESDGSIRCGSVELGRTSSGRIYFDFEDVSGVRSRLSMSEEHTLRMIRAAARLVALGGRNCELADGIH